MGKAGFPAVRDQSVALQGDDVRVHGQRHDVGRQPADHGPRLAREEPPCDCATVTVWPVVRAYAAENARSTSR